MSTPEKLRVLNRSHYIDYQDCKYAGGDRMLCSGLNNYKRDAPTAPSSASAASISSIWPTVVRSTRCRSCSGAVRTGHDAESGLDRGERAGLRAYFMPDDDKSTLYIYDAATK